MKKSSLHSALPQHSVAIGESGSENAGLFVKTANPVDPTWIPTVVNPAENGSPMEKGLFWFHLLIWVVALGLTATCNFGAAVSIVAAQTLYWHPYHPCVSLNSCL